jgi:calcineurin-like phosphoesterase family protein
MKITQEVLTKWYLDDLTLPDVHHGRDTPKVRNIAAWKAITPYVKQESSAPSIDPFRGDVWVWSDTHFGHNNIIKYTAPLRPFASKEEMNAVMIANYLAVVGPEDIVIFGGDVCFGSVNAMNDILHSLPGYKIQIVGNHDMHRDGTLYELDFDERHLCLPVSIVEPDGVEYQLHFTHYPMDSVPANSVNVHGHIHQWLANPWNINICVEHTGSAPRNLRDVCAQARNYLEQK